jgi:hypothetical protein
MVFGKGITSFSDAHTINVRGGRWGFFTIESAKQKTTAKKAKAMEKTRIRPSSSL